MSEVGGILGLPWDDGILDAMLGTMKKQGQDPRACSGYENICILGTELASVATPQEDYVLTWDGELYNSGDIRNSLIKLGHPFYGDSLEEMVLRAYIQWGSNCVDRFNGVFSFGILEKSAKRLFIARDRMGGKPLFYMEHDGGMLFASSIKTILHYPDVRAELDEEGAAQILLLGPGKIPGSAVFRGIRELEPGCCGIWECGHFAVRRYWSVKDRHHTESFEDTCHHVRQLVLDAVLRQSAGTDSLGTFLSGGLDSSLITAICAERLQHHGKQLGTFSVDYADSDRYFAPNAFQPNSDGHYISIMEHRFHTNHKKIVLTPEQLYSHLQEATEARELPGMADVDVSLLLFCREVKKNADVVLSGECADEIFGGYPWYRDPGVRNYPGFPWARNQKQRFSLMLPDLKRKIDGPEFIRQQYEKTCNEADILPDITGEDRRIKQMVNLNLRWFMQTLCDRNDRMSRAAGLTVRTPFSDYRIAEYLYGIPWQMKDYEGREKGLLRKAAEGLLPDEVLWRKKSPYPKTFDPAYEKMVADGIRSLLLQNDAPLFSLVSREQTQTLLEADFPWPWYGQLMRRPQILAYLLQINMWMKEFGVELVY